MSEFEKRSFEEIAATLEQVPVEDQSQRAILTTKAVAALHEGFEKTFLGWVEGMERARSNPASSLAELVGVCDGGDEGMDLLVGAMVGVLVMGAITENQFIAASVTDLSMRFVIGIAAREKVLKDLERKAADPTLTAAQRDFAEMRIGDRRSNLEKMRERLGLTPAG